MSISQCSPCRLLRRIALAGAGLAWLVLSVNALAAKPVYAEPIYKDDPQFVAKLKALKPGEGLVMETTFLGLDGKPVPKRGYSGPYARDYTNKMVYAPDRETALYCGGNHNAGRMNDVWEYHLGSNTWHQLHEADGGDHASHKYMLAFYPRLLLKDPKLKLTEAQEKQLERAKAWWRENVTEVDGLFVTKKMHAPLLMGHTWDTLMYDPVNKRLVHGTGANNATRPQLQELLGDPSVKVSPNHGNRADGTPWRGPWTFDPVAKKWSPYAHASELSELRGMGASLLFIPDQKKAIFYYAGDNSPGSPKTMTLWDLEKDTWERMAPNGTTNMGKLFLQKVAPAAEQQMVYSPRHKRIIAVIGKVTYGYDFAKNEWSRLNESVPFSASDARTVFVYDSTNDVCLLSSPKTGGFAVYDVKTNKWESVTPSGDLPPQPKYGVGFGYYDAKHNVMVVRPSTFDKMWFYRHK